MYIDYQLDSFFIQTIILHFSAKKDFIFAVYLIILYI